MVKSLFTIKDERLLLVNSKGISISIPTSSIRITGRAASGVRLMKLEPGSRVIDARLMDNEPETAVKDSTEEQNQILSPQNDA